MVEAGINEADPRRRHLFIGGGVCHVMCAETHRVACARICAHRERTEAGIVSHLYL